MEKLEQIKQSGAGTVHELVKHAVHVELPKKGQPVSMPTSILNSWYDKFGNRYTYLMNSLSICITSFQESLIAYTNKVDNEVNIVIQFEKEDTPISEINKMLVYLKTYPTNNNITINLSNIKFKQNAVLEYRDLPKNVKISSMPLEKEETELLGDNSFDWYSLNLDEVEFAELLTVITKGTTDRVKSLREIAFAFYQSNPGIENMSNEEKMQLAYNWVEKNTSNASEAVNVDGTLNPPFAWTQDPLKTFIYKRGVSSGRSRLLKLLVNNHYLNVPCYLVKGMVKSRPVSLPHEWNELILENGSNVFYDIEKMESYFDIDRSDYQLNKEKKKKKTHN